MISRKKILIIAVVAVAAISVVAVAGFYLWQGFMASFGEVENAIKTFLDRVNGYDTTGAWALTSSDYQSSWGEYSEFELLIQSLEAKQWSSQIQSISSKSIETSNGQTTASFTLTAAISDTEHSGEYNETWIFELVKVGNQWKIDDWLIQD